MQIAHALVADREVAGEIGRLRVAPVKLFGDLERLLVELQGLLPVPQASVQIAHLVVADREVAGEIGRLRVALDEAAEERSRGFKHRPLQCPAVAVVEGPDAGRS